MTIAKVHHRAAAHNIHIIYKLQCADELHSPGADYHYLMAQFLPDALNTNDSLIVCVCVVLAIRAIPARNISAAAAQILSVLVFV
jgi:hypothetical protein